MGCASTSKPTVEDAPAMTTRAQKRKRPLETQENSPAGSSSLGETEKVGTQTIEDCYTPTTVPVCCRRVKNPAHVCLESFEHLLTLHQPTCQLIETGKVKSRHHDEYNISTLQSRRTRMKDKNSFSGLRFCEEQLDFLAHWMRKEMCQKKSSKYVDYCLRVHMNELLTRVFMDIKRIKSFSEAELQMAPTPVKYSEADLQSMKKALEEQQGQQQ